MGDEDVEDENQEAGNHDALGAGLAEFEGAAVDTVAVEGGNRGHDEGEDEGLGDGVYDVVYAETVGEAVDEVVHGDAAGDDDREIAAEDGEEDAEHYQHRVDNEGCDDFGQDEVGGGIDAHDFEGVDLLGDAHTADFCRDAGSEVAHQQQTDNRRAEFHHNGRPGYETHGPMRNPAAFDLHGGLRGDNAAHGDGYDADNQHGTNAHGIHFIDKFFKKNAPLLRAGEGLAQEDEILSDCG